MTYAAYFLNFQAIKMFSPVWTSTMELYTAQQIKGHFDNTSDLNGKKNNAEYVYSYGLGNVLGINVRTCSYIETTDGVVGVSSQIWSRASLSPLERLGCNLVALDGPKHDVPEVLYWI